MRALIAIATLVIREIFRKKDFYVAFVLIAVVLFYAQGLAFYNVQNVSRYLMEIGLALITLVSVVLTVALTARQYPSEVQNRTGPLLLAKPIHRWQFVLGKTLGALLAGAACFTIFYVLFLGIVWHKAGTLSCGVAFQVYYLFLLNLLVVSAMASAFSYHLTTGANVTVSLILYVLINTYGAQLKGSASWVYYVWPHFEFFDLRHRFVHDWPGLSLTLIAVITLYALIYSTFFLAWACASFRRRPL